MLLLSLPEDLVIVILQHAEPSCLFRCRQVCRALNELLSTTSTLKYKCTLWQNGYADFPTAESLSIAQKQARLEGLAQGWGDPQWSDMARVPLFREGTTYELQGGIFVSGRPSSEDHRSTRGLLFWELPWRDYDAEDQLITMQAEPPHEPTWVIPDLGVDVHDFQIDPAQDLLVLVAKGKSNTGDGTNVITVHIRNMSDGVAHPETEVPLKQLELHQTPEGHPLVVIGFIIQIVDDILGILTCFRSFNVEAPPPFDVVLSRSRVDIFNWKTGVTYACIEDDGIDSIIFLDEETIMLVRRVGDIIPKTISLDVFKYSLSASVKPPASRTSEYPLSPLGARLIARFFFPHMPDEPGVITHVIARCEPTPSYRETPIKRPRQMQSPAPTTRPAQSARIVSLSFVTLQPHFPPLERPFIFLFFAETIRKLATKYGNGTCTQLNWETWGPQNTRILERAAPSQWICYTYGSKFAYLNTTTGQAVVTILDFNPAAVRTGEDVVVETYPGGIMYKRWETEHNYGVYTNSSRDVAALGSWTSDTSSALPYVKFESTTTFRGATSVMIDHERVIVATREFFGDAFIVFNV